MAIGTPSLLLSGGSTTDGTTFAGTLSGTPASGSLILVALSWSRGGTPASAPTTVTVAGLTLTTTAALEHQYKTAATNRISCGLYYGTSTSFSGTGFDVSGFGYTALGCRWDVYEITGTKVSGTNGSDAIVQSAKNAAATNVLDGATGTVSLASSTPDSSASRCFLVCGFNGNAVGLSPEANWTELSEDVHSTPSEDLMTAWRSDAFDQTVVVTNNTGLGANMGLIIVELAAAAGTPGVASPATVAVGVTIPAPTVTGAATVSPATVAVTATIPIPVFPSPGVVSPDTVAVAVTVPAPSVSGAGKASPATVSVVVTMPAPSVGGAATASPSTVSVVVSIPTPTFPAEVVVAALMALRTLGRELLALGALMQEQLALSSVGTLEVLTLTPVEQEKLAMKTFVRERLVMDVEVL